MTQNTENKDVNADSLASSFSADKAKVKRNKLLGRLALVTLVLSLSYIGYMFLIAAHYVQTDNAYVSTETAQVNALTAGPVLKIMVSETMSVKAGDLLLEIDDSDAKIALQQAQASLALASRKVAGYYASDTMYSGQIGAREAGVEGAHAKIAAAQSDLNLARTELERRQSLVASGAVSRDELSLAQNQHAKAEQALNAAVATKDEALAQLEAAKGARQGNQVLFSGVSPTQNPEIVAAQARLDAAKLNLDRTKVRAPMDGLVAKRSVQIGQQVQIGTPLMAIVPIQNAYVDANFKEVQLKDVKIGQDVVLTSDLYGKKIKYHGKVMGISGGTGAVFSLIPAQNASGNWIKVVQRLPVRISLDPNELKAHPLRSGLSMAVKIDISK